MQANEGAAAFDSAAAELDGDLAAYTAPQMKVYEATVRGPAPGPGLAPAWRHVKIQVWPFFDLPYRDEIKILDLEKKISAESDFQTQLVYLREQMGILCCDADATDIDALSRTQMIEVGRLASGLPLRPPIVSGAVPTGEIREPSASATSSPGPLASSAGPTIP